MTPLSVEIWSDIACPWCYVGKRRFEAALARFEHRAQVAVRRRAFELAPSAPSTGERVDYAQRLAKKYSTSLDRARQMIRSMTDAGAGEGLTLDFARIRPGNTLDAHRLVQLAARDGKQDQAEERLFRAYLSEGQAICDRAVLVRLGIELGLDPRRVREMLESGEFEREVREDEDLARRRGIQAVPFFLFAGRHGAPGAQPPEQLSRLFEQAWSERDSPDAPGAVR